MRDASVSATPAHHRTEASEPMAPSAKMTAKVYVIMALTTTVTFATLTTGYRLLFVPQVFA